MVHLRISVPKPLYSVQDYSLDETITSMLDQLQTEGQCCGMADWSEFNSPSVKGWNGSTVGRDPRTDQSELWDRRKHTIISDRPKRRDIYDVRSSFCCKIVLVDRTDDLKIDKKADRDKMTVILIVSAIVAAIQL